MYTIMGDSENAIREALLMRYDRDSYTLASKLPAFIIRQEKKVETIFEEQRNKCGVQFFDYYLYNLNKILYNGVDGKGGTVKRFHMFERMQNWEAAGKIHHIGFLFHDDAETLGEILTDHPEVEFVRIAFNYYDYESPFLQAKKCYDVIQKHGCQMVVMEPVKGGMLASVPEKTGAEMKKMHPELSEASWVIRFAADLNYIKGQLAKNHYTVGDKLPEEKVILADGTDVTEQVVKVEKWLIEHGF